MKKNTVLAGVLSLILITGLILGSKLPREMQSVSMEMSQEDPQIVREPIVLRNEKEQEGRSGMLFAGDVYFSDYVTQAYEKAGGVEGILDVGYLSEIKKAEAFMVNQEFPFSEKGTPANKEYTFRLEPSWVKLFEEMNVSVVTLANNHILDYGSEALLDTMRVLREKEIDYVGAGTNLPEAMMMESFFVDGKKIGVLGASRVYPEASWAATKQGSGVLSAYDPATLLEAVETENLKCEYLVVYLHWGIEKNEMPEAYQRDLAHQLIDAGADLVIGSHPHVLQGIEYYQGKPIVYSLGNFIFGSKIPRTALLKVRFEDGIELSLIPGLASNGYTMMVRDAEEKRLFFDYMESISFGIRIDESGRVMP